MAKVTSVKVSADNNKMFTAETNNDDTREFNEYDISSGINNKVLTNTADVTSFDDGMDVVAVNPAGDKFVGVDRRGKEAHNLITTNNFSVNSFTLGGSFKMGIPSPIDLTIPFTNETIIDMTSLLNGTSISFRSFDVIGDKFFVSYQSSVSGIGGLTLDVFDKNTLQLISRVRPKPSFSLYAEEACGFAGNYYYIIDNSVTTPRRYEFFPFDGVSVDFTNKVFEWVPDFIQQQSATSWETVGPLTISNDGTKVYTVPYSASVSGRYIYEYTLNTPGDITSVNPTYNQRLITQTSNPVSMQMVSNSSSLVITNRFVGTLNQVNINPTGGFIDIVNYNKTTLNMITHTHSFFMDEKNNHAYVTPRVGTLVYRYDYTSL